MTSYGKPTIWTTSSPAPPQFFPQGGCYQVLQARLNPPEERCLPPFLFFCPSLFSSSLLLCPSELHSANTWTLKPRLRDQAEMAGYGWSGGELLDKEILV